MAKRSGLVALLILAITLLAAPAAAADGGGKISGQVVDYSAGADAIGALEVRLHTMAGTTQETAPAVSVTSDANGRFSFAGLSTDAKTSYLVTAVYRQIEYASDLVTFKAGETERTIEVAVFETTDRGDAVTLRQQHLIVTPDAENRVLKVVEIAIVQNAGDRTYVGTPVGDERQSVKLLLPSGAYDVELVQLLSTRGTLIPGGVAYTGPIAPGQTQLVLGYALEYGNGAAFEKVLALATAAVDVLVEDSGVVVRSQQLFGPESVQIGPSKYLRLTGKDLAPGSVVRLEIMPAGGGSPLSSLGSIDGLAPFAPIGLLLAIGAVTAYLIVAPKIRRPRLLRARHGDARPEPGAGRGPQPARAKDDDETEELPEELVEK